mmetsp:Transcript_48250/g.114328  ORF Transcript_48250/g.114328 Transcript_48250/m.114328 type:complete len:302 (-) Transcript_48250:1173-2078(-)
MRRPQVLAIRHVVIAGVEAGPFHAAVAIASGRMPDKQRVLHQHALVGTSVGERCCARHDNVNSGAGVRGAQSADLKHRHVRDFAVHCVLVDLPCLQAWQLRASRPAHVRCVEPVASQRRNDLVSGHEISICAVHSVAREPCTLTTRCHIVPQLRLGALIVEHAHHRAQIRVVQSLALSCASVSVPEDSHDSQIALDGVANTGAAQDFEGRQMGPKHDTILDGDTFRFLDLNSPRVPTVKGHAPNGAVERLQVLEGDARAEIVLPEVPELNVADVDGAFKLPAVPGSALFGLTTISVIFGVG